jgi:chorismate mutase
MSLSVLNVDAQIEEERKAIDDVDLELVALIRRRLGHSLAIAQRKAELGISIYDPARERAIVARVGPEYVRTVYRAVVEECRRAGQAATADRKRIGTRR